MLHAMVMAGGGGTRLWPRSRRKLPKQFLNLVGERTLLQMALDRIEALAVPPERSWVLTAENYRRQTVEQLPQLPVGHLVGEPCGRDTAPCIALAAALIEREDPDAVMIVTPADHVIEPVQEFRRAAQVAAAMAEEYSQALITFGIAPTYPATGYGYIHRGEQVATRQGIGVYRVGRFEEKPPLEKAEKFFASGEYYWNSGIFVWKVSTILQALRTHKPAMFESVNRIADAWESQDRLEVLAQEYAAIEKISIDYAVMQEHPDILVVQTPYRWDDVGSWLAVERMQPQDAGGNTVLGTHCGLKTENCVILGDKGKLITTIGVRDLLIIQDGDCLLVAHRDDEGTVKPLLDELRKRGLEEFL